MTKRLLNQRGFALEATLIYIVLLTALIGAGVASMVMVQRAGGVDYRSSRVTYSAEAGADAIMAQLATDMQDGKVTSAELAALTTPTLPGFTYSAPVVQKTDTATATTITTGTYKGLIGLNQPIDITMEASDAASNRAKVVVSVVAQAIPLFQFGVFYDGDLEIHNGPDMTFLGWVHSNKKLYLTPGVGAGHTWFKDIITTPDSVLRKYKDSRTDAPHDTFIDNASGVSSELTFDSRVGSTSFVNQSQSLFDSRLKSGVSGGNVSALTLPLPAGVPAITMIQDKAGDPADIQAVKFAYKSDLYIRVDLGPGANPLAAPCAVMTMTGQNGRSAPSLAQCAAIFSGGANKFWEGREDKGVDILNLDVAALNAWNAGQAQKVNIIYVTFLNSSGNANRDYPALRMVNGDLLAYPLTISSDRPLYVKGDYNNDIAWQPASLIGDAITFLSNNWVDPGTPPTTWCSCKPGAAETWVYAAVAAGHSPSVLNGAYGGGLENFPRFLESWPSATPSMHYTGSLVSLWSPNYANLQNWSWRGYYDAPRRDWNFDMRFRQPENLPPGTPVVGNVIQTGYRPVF